MQKAIEIVAEIAQGYEGNPKQAELLVRGALAAGADAVKIQLVFADELCVPTYPYYDLFKSLEMSEEIWQSLAARVVQAEKKLYFDVYGPQSMEWAKRLGAHGVKISTTDFYNQPLINSALAGFARVFISIGGVPIDDLEALLNTISEPQKVVLMHGFQAEPTLTEDNHLNRLATLRTRFPNYRFGFMDHSQGNSDEAFYLPLMAMSLGAEVIEKHLSLDYSLQIEDYISALSPERFAQFAKILRQMQPALGQVELSLSGKEVEYKKRAGKVAVARRDLSAGTQLGEADIILKRVSTTPSDLHVRRTDLVLGKTLRQAIAKDQPFEPGVLA